MSAPSISEPESDFVCDCYEAWRSVCAREPFYEEQGGKRYCVFHVPGYEKRADFEKALQRKLDNKDFDFRGVWFPDYVSFFKFDFTADANFSSATFGAEANFRLARFSARAHFTATTFSSWVDFIHATFSGEVSFLLANFKGKASFLLTSFGAKADFNSATFIEEAAFGSSTFSAPAYFLDATFNKEADFSTATFTEGANFSTATFRDEANFTNSLLGGSLAFRGATFGDYVRFAGNENRRGFGASSSLDLESARIERPDHVSFHTLTLRPQWFVNVDPRKFEFTNVDWDCHGINEEMRTRITLARLIAFSAPPRMLAVACRHLAVNSEENNRYEEASNFRYMAMEVWRREAWRGLAFWKLSWWYWLASGYGERVVRAFLVLLSIWFVAGLLYTQVGFARWEPRLASENDVVIARRDDVGAPLKFSRALTYSVGVMTFQKPEPRPATIAAQTVVLLETVLGPVQVALLALAIRRKFMR